MKSYLLKIVFIIITLLILFYTGIKKYSINRQSYNNIKTALEIKDNLKQLEYVNQTIQMRPDWSIPYILRAKIYYFLNKYEDVQKDINIAIKLQPMKFECMGIIASLKTIKNPPKKEDKAEAINSIETEFDSVFSNVSPITLDWVTWLAYSLVPIFIMVLLTFFLPDYLKSHHYNNFGVIIGIKTGVFLLMIFFCSMMIGMSPSAMGVTLVMISAIVISCCLYDDFYDAVIEKDSISAQTKFWICKKCQTENTSEHFNCWKCSNPKEVPLT